MFRALFRTACTARQCAFNVHETCVLPVKYDNAARPVFRLGRSVGVRPLNTSSSSYSESKDNAPSPTPPPQLNDKEDVHKGSDTSPLATESEPAMKKEAEETAAECEATKQPEKGEETPLTTTKKTAEDAGDKKIKMEVKTGKSDLLLGLLGTMKVDVTQKRRPRDNQSTPWAERADTTPAPAAMESSRSAFQRATVERALQSGESLSPELVAAASSAAATMPDPRRAESELLKQLRKHERRTDDPKKGEASSIGAIISDMKVGKQAPKKHSQRAQILFDENGQQYNLKRGKLFKGRRLSIFNPATFQESPDLPIVPEGPSLWDTEYANSLVQSTNQMPRNGFEEMIQWTKEGRIWQYPINNEIGLDEEAAVPFHEHVFLDGHLEEGFPHQGPVRHFMELVVSGLSKNHHLSVRQKTDHIDWFRLYFQEKSELLNEDSEMLN